jgi:3-oxoacyl-[acyl-carrier protein] reductase
MKLKDRVALVTGGASGIGAASSIAMAREGARVVVADLNEAAASAIAERVKRSGGQALAMRADVTRAADNQAMVERAVSTWGGLDVFYANAGVPQWKVDIEQVEDSVYDRIMDVNVKGVWLGAKYALPVMKRAKRGVFLVTASTAGIRPRPGLTVYNSSKGAVIIMSKSMAAEFGPDKVRVNCVNPVFSPDTSLSAEFAGGTLSEEAKKRFLVSIPLGRFSTPRDVANACLYLASDEAAMVSGVCIEVDGARCV